MTAVARPRGRRVIRRSWRRLGAAYDAMCLRVGARILALYSAAAAVAGVEILGFLTVWPLALVGIVIAVAALVVVRRRRLRLRR